MPLDTDTALDVLPMIAECDPVDGVNQDTDINDDTEERALGDHEHADTDCNANGSRRQQRKMLWECRLKSEPVRRAVVYGLLPGLAVTIAFGAGYLQWRNGATRLSHEAATQSLQAATDSTIAILSYQPDTADKQLHAARDRLTGKFRDDYTKLTDDLVVPGAKSKHISSAATVPAAASISANQNRAVALLFVNQTIIIADDAPTYTASSVQVSLDKVGGRWLISQFDPV